MTRRDKWVNELNQNLGIDMLRSLLFQYLIGVCLLFAGCVLSGLVINEMRSKPLPLTYSTSLSPETSSRPIAATAFDDVDLSEMQKICSTHGALILDARPENLYRSGHIPSAVSLPRDDFNQHYQALRANSLSDRNRLVIVYCTNFHCPESQIVAAALQRLGYPHVRLFRGGWNEWQSANLPEGKP